MADPASPPRLIRFGVFEVDVRTGELRKQGLKVHLQDQPYEILTMLLERPGELVSREELRQKLWPDGTFVDFEHGLNKAVNKIREALGDSADNPRFVETLPRRGYRFIYPVDSVAPVSSPALEAAMRTSPLQRHFVALAACVVVIMLAFAAYWLMRPLPPPRVTNAVRIARLHGGTWFWPLLTDGVRLYFTDHLGDRSVTMQVPLVGGEAVPIPTPFRYAGAVDISLKRAELLVCGGDSWGLEMPLWVMPLVGGSPRRVGDIVGGGPWSPDGQRILYSKGSDLYLAKDDGTESRKLASAPGTINWAAWSPDGTTIRFSVYPKSGGGESVLYEVSAGGTDLRRLLPGWSRPSGVEVFGIWTPDGKYFIFSGSPDFTLVPRYDLWATREKAGLFRKPDRTPVRLTAGPIGYFSPLLSPDGKKLFAIGGLSHGELVRFEAKAQRFVPYLSGISASDVDFSRDGQWAAYVAWPEGTLWHSKVDGSERLQLTSPPLSVILPRWSPDGKQIAFMGQTPGKPWKIHLVSAAGGAPQQLIPGEREEADPQWSPDGNQLLFGRWPANPSEPVALHLLDLKASQVSTVPGSEGLRSPRWSYDGRYVAALGDGDRKLVLFDFKTHRQIELAKSKGGIGFQNWSRDGTSIYFWNVPTEGQAGIYRVRLSDRKLDRIVSDKELGRIFGASGDWVGLAPDDSPLVMRDVTLTEIYALDWEAP